MGRSRKHIEEEAEGIPEWMLTYSDLVTLLLTFFIMLFSMATLDNQKFIEVAKSLKSSFLHVSNGELFATNQGKDLFSIVEQNNAVDVENSEVNNGKEFPGQEAEKEKKLDSAREEAKSAITSLNLGEFVKVIEEEGQLILRIDSVILFDLGSADIKESGKPILKKLGTALKQLDNDILVQGHTDNLPIYTSLYPTNWELSTKRATNVVLFLIQNCSLEPPMLTATGNGEYKPIMPNDTEANRQKNRRIDIVIKK